MALPLRVDYPPMEAKLVDALPDGRRLAIRAQVGRLPLPRVPGRRRRSTCARRPASRSTATFPEIVDARARAAGAAFVLDGEIVVPVGDVLSFDELLLRIHPAASRVAKLAARASRRSSSCSTCSSTRAGRSLVDQPLARPAAKRSRASCARIRGSVRAPPVACDRRGARPRSSGCGAGRRPRRHRGQARRLRLPLRRAHRHAEVQAPCARPIASSAAFATRAKTARSSARCCSASTTTRASSTTSASRRHSARRARGADARGSSSSIAPAGIHRARAGRTEPLEHASARGEWQPLAPEARRRGAATTTSAATAFATARSFLRWRPDKAPRQCTFEQVMLAPGASLDLLDDATRRSPA